MTPLEKIIRQKIRLKGSLSVADFMALALGDPEHGYYMTRDPFGRGGDFTTAPEISQMFGELLGLWVADVWMKLDRPETFDLIECGPGRGTLMADSLRATKSVKGFHDAARVILMEISPVLREKQKETLRDCNVQWVESFEDTIIRSSDYPVVLLANEFLDALPVQQWRHHNGEEEERLIVVNEHGRLSFSFSNEDKMIERSPYRENFTQTVAKLLRQRRGAALFIDYGHTGGFGDTLQAVKNHKYAPVLEDIGNADLTSHVDFAALKLAAQDVKVLGPVGQGAFLERLGIRERSEKLRQNSERERLTAPEKMGRLFKVMALCHDVIPEGF